VHIVETKQVEQPMKQMRLRGLNLSAVVTFFEREISFEGSREDKEISL
jgi:hypothetical protein